MKTKGSRSFDFGKYNDVGYSQAVVGKALVDNSAYLRCFLEAGRFKVHVNELRDLLKMLQVRFSSEFDINPTRVEFVGFAGFVCKRTNLMLYHLRRLLNDVKKHNCLSKMSDPNDVKTLSLLLSKVADLQAAGKITPDAARSPSPSPPPKSMKKKHKIDPADVPQSQDDYELDDEGWPKLPESPTGIGGSTAARSSAQPATAVAAALKLAQAAAAAPSTAAAKARADQLPGERTGIKAQAVLKRPAAAAAAKAARASTKTTAKKPAAHPTSTSQNSSNNSGDSNNVERHESAALGTVRLSMFRDKGYIQRLSEEDGKWKLLVNCPYENKDENTKSMCHGILQQVLHFVVTNPKATKEKAIALKDKLLAKYMVQEESGEESPSEQQAESPAPLEDVDDQFEKLLKHGSGFFDFDSW